MRGETPSLRTMEVATASVGLWMAPRAMPMDRLMPGMTAAKTTPSTSELMSTRNTDSPPMAVKSRRKSMEGRLTAVA